jgi:LysR family transcriptional activator of glutamate synthase operon
MDIRKLEIFCEVVKRKSFSAAAKKLGITQSAVSQQVKVLEADLGVELLNRNDRKIASPAGQYLYNEANLLLSQIRDISQGVLKAAGFVSGTVRFGMIDVAAITIMPGLIKKFKSRYSGIALEAVVRATGELLEKVDNHELDFAVLVTNGLEADYSCINVYKDSIVAVVPRKSSLARKEISIRDLKGEPLILYPATSYSRKVIEEVFRMSGVVPTVNMEMHYPAAICSLVREGMGIGLISRLSADAHTLKGQKKVVIRELVGVRNIGILKHKRRALSPQAGLLIDILSKKRR